MVFSRCRSDWASRLRIRCQKAVESWRKVRSKTRCVDSVCQRRCQPWSPRVLEAIGHVGSWLDPTSSQQTFWKGPRRHVVWVLLECLGSTMQLTKPHWTDAHAWEWTLRQEGKMWLPQKPFVKSIMRLTSGAGSKITLTRGWELHKHVLDQWGGLPKPKDSGKMRGEARSREEVNRKRVIHCEKDTLSAFSRRWRLPKRDVKKRRQP